MPTIVFALFGEQPRICEQLRVILLNTSSKTYPHIKIAPYKGALHSNFM